MIMMCGELAPWGEYLEKAVAIPAPIPSFRERQQTNMLPFVPPATTTTGRYAGFQV